ncbi:unnamed protein product [Phaedon cochleariae]|uniref:Uncharacterized protein n=1 Tax=Phaedon cochleariae TaxID=80249 RepID=A0A9N9SFI9_PHACE|nr:unnamed protein product [Phaedon cochleariae]
MSQSDISDNQVLTCCETEESTVDDSAPFFDALENNSSEKKVDIAIFHYVLKQKDQIMNELQNNIKILTNQIDLLNKLNCDQTATNTNKKVVPVRSAPKKTSTTIDNKNEPAENSELEPKVNSLADININKNTDITMDKVSEGISLAQNAAIMQEIINLPFDKGMKTETKTEWKTVPKRNSRRQRQIVGQNNDLSIKGVPRKTVLHVCRINKDSSADDLKSTLQKHFPEVHCHQITAKYPDLYSSFKVRILEENFNKAMDPNIWPIGAYVNLLQKKTKLILTQDSLAENGTFISDISQKQ